MSRKRSKWKFSPARKRRPAAIPAVVRTVNEEKLLDEPEAVPEWAESIETEPEVVSEWAESIETIPSPESEEKLSGEAAEELPEYFFDEEDFKTEEIEAKELAPEEPDADEDDPDEDDLLDEEPPLSLYERGGAGKRRGKKKDSGKNKKGKNKEPVVKPVRIGDVVIGDGVPKICVPITGRSGDEILAQAREVAAASPDLVEWRVDYLEEAGGKRDIVDILFALRGILRDTPLLFTYRTEGEGGLGRVGWSHYAELLEWAACRPEIDLIDVEAMGLDVDTEGLIRIIHGRGTPVVASVHYCGEMPDKKERKEAIRFLKQSGGDIIKMAVTPQSEEDVLDFMVWTRRQSRKMEQPLITMAMGDVGKVSRVSGRLTGSAVTFGSVGEASAAGQIPAAELRTILEHV